MSIHGKTPTKRTAKSNNKSNANEVLPPFHSLLPIGNESIYQNKLSESGATVNQFGIYPHLNPTDEFFFTAQQMAAQIFDHYGSNAASYYDCSTAFYGTSSYDEAAAQHLLYSSVALTPENQTPNSSFHSGSFQSPQPLQNGSWADFSANTSSSSSNSSSSDGNHANFGEKLNCSGSSSATPSGPEEFQPLSNRQTVLMLPPPVNYRRRNERERERVRCVNDGYSRLREIIPVLRHRQKRISKVETLRAASRYIRSLHEALGMPVPNGYKKK